VATNKYDFVVSAVLCIAFLVAFIGCGNNRTESRQQRLDSFRQILPESICTEFDLIQSQADCNQVGLLLAEARSADAGLNAVIDSVMHAELIDTFTETELVYFFWYYFASAIETGNVTDF